MKPCQVVAHQHLPIFHTEHCVFARFLSKGSLGRYGMDIPSTYMLSCRAVIAWSTSRMQGMISRTAATPARDHHCTYGTPTARTTRPNAARKQFVWSVCALRLAEVVADMGCRNTVFNAKEGTVAMAGFWAFALKPLLYMSAECW